MTNHESSLSHRSLLSTVVAEPMALLVCKAGVPASL